MKTNSKEELARFGNDQIKGAEYALEIINLQGDRIKYSVDSKTYWKFADNFGENYGKTVIFQTAANKRVRGILQNAISVLDLKGAE